MNNLFLLPFVICYGIIISYFDIKFKKIPNLLNLISLILALFLNISFWYFFYRELIPFSSWSISLIKSILLNFFILFLLWLFELISAADVKTFLVFSTLLPPTIIIQEPFYHFIIFQTAILIAFITLFPKIITTKTNILPYLKEIFSLKFIFSIIIYSFSISYLGSLLFSLLKIKTNIIFVEIFFFFILFLILEFILGKYMKWFSIIISIVRIFLDYEKLIKPKYLFSEILYPIFTLYLIIILIYYSYSAFTKEISIKNLKPGMILANKFIKKNKKIVPIKEVRRNIYDYLFNKLKQDEFEKSINYSRKRGLTMENINKLKQLYKNKILATDKVLVYDEIPFSVYLFIATLLIILLNGDPLIEIMKFLR